MFFHLGAVSDAIQKDILDETARRLLFHAHVSALTVGSFTMTHFNVNAKMVYLDLEVVPGQLASQDHLHQIVLHQRKIDSQGRLNAT